MTSPTSGSEHDEEAPDRSGAGHEPLWGVGKVSSMLGIATPTLRTWDRRYNLGPSRRTEGGHRRYSEADIARVELMSRLLDHGVPAQQAAAVAVTTDDSDLDSPPSLAPIRHQPRLVSARPGSSSRATASAIAGVVAAAEALDPSGLARHLGQVFERRGVVGGWSDVVVPALRTIGDRWSRGEVGTEVEHLASERLATELRGMVKTGPTSRATSRPVLLAGAPDELHALPLFALEAALAERQVATVTLGPATTETALATAVTRTRPRAVFVWASMPRDLPTDWLDSCPESAHPRAVVLGGPGWPDERLSGPPDLVITRVHDLTSALAALDATA